MSTPTQRTRLLLAASALALAAGVAHAEGLVSGVDAGANANVAAGVDAQGNGTEIHVGTDVDAEAGAGAGTGTVLAPRHQSADATAETGAEAGAGVTLTAPSQPGAEASADVATQGSASLAAWTPADFAGASVVNETGMRIATVDSVVADTAGAVNLVLAIDAQPGAKRAVPFERFDLGTSGNALLLVGVSDADLVAMADYQAAAGAYAPITTDAELKARLQAAAGR